MGGEREEGERREREKGSFLQDVTIFSNSLVSASKNLFPQNYKPFLKKRTSLILSLLITLSSLSSPGSLQKRERKEKRERERNYPVTPRNVNETKMEEPWRDTRKRTRRIKRTRLDSPGLAWTRLDSPQDARGSRLQHPPAGDEAERCSTEGLGPSSGETCGVTVESMISLWLATRLVLTSLYWAAIRSEIFCCIIKRSSLQLSSLLQNSVAVPI